MARVLPGPYKTSPPKLVCQHELPDGDIRKYMMPKVTVKDIGILISKVCPKLDITRGVGPHNVEETRNQVFVKEIGRVNYHQQTGVQSPSNSFAESSDNQLDSSNVAPSPNNLSIFNKYSNAEKVSSNSDEITSLTHTNPWKFSSNSEEMPSLRNSSPRKWSSNSEEIIYSKNSNQKKSSSYSKDMASSVKRKLQNSQEITLSPKKRISSFREKQKGFSYNSLKLKRLHPSKHYPSKHYSSKRHSSKRNGRKNLGFLGFPEEDSNKLKKTRFHVNTNILASSLDLLDLHKNAGMRTGSPLECSACGITFSSVRHCKYHQSVCATDSYTDPARYNNVKGDGVWLCPWCPVVCLTTEYLNKHKLLCRERGRCLHDGKASSQRKPLVNPSKRRNSLPTSDCIKSNVLLNRSSSFKVVHGRVIPG